MKVEKVVIIGGGSSGWMTAAYIASTVGRALPLEITLIESGDIGTIGVGEATTLPMVGFLRDLGIDESEFLIKTNGAFKNGICFREWLHEPEKVPGDYYFHPFDLRSSQDLYAALHNLYYNPDSSSNEFGRLVSPQVLACEMNRAPKSFSRSGAERKQRPVSLDYAYHMDAVLFARMLRSRFEQPAGMVKRVEATVVGFERDSSGHIASVVLEGGGRVDGELFIDCSGFRSIALQKEMDVGFQKFSEYLPCDRAVAARKPYAPGERIKPYTIAHAQKAGWIWDISLSSRRGIGYVFSSSHLTDDEAVCTLARYSGVPPEELDPFFIPMKTGYSEELWSGNCVAIGLSGGFIEPLESTGLLLTQLGVQWLTHNWPEKEYFSGFRDQYNRIMHEHYQEFLFLVMLHYVTSNRRDTAFWKDATRPRNDPPLLWQMLALWKHRHPAPSDRLPFGDQIWSFKNYAAILAGMGYFRGMLPTYAPSDDGGNLRNYLASRSGAFQKIVAGLPEHEEYLAALARY